LMHSVWCAEGKSSWLEQEGSERTRFELEIFVYFLTNFYFMQITRFCWFFVNFGSIDRVAQQIALPTTQQQQRIHLLFESTHEWYKSSIKHSSYVSHFSCSCVYVNVLNLMFFLRPNLIQFYFRIRLTWIWISRDFWNFDGFSRKSAENSCRSNSNVADGKWESNNNTISFIKHQQSTSKQLSTATIQTTEIQK
jgi:hypothetical protein